MSYLKRQLDFFKKNYKKTFTTEDDLKQFIESNFKYGGSSLKYACFAENFTEAENLAIKFYKDIFNCENEDESNEFDESEIEFESERYLVSVDEIPQKVQVDFYLFYKEYGATDPSDYEIYFTIYY